jgi:AraC-like DNA-binding protein/PAS domain-containing protein
LENRAVGEGAVQNSRSPRRGATGEQAKGGGWSQTGAPTVFFAHDSQSARLRSRPQDRFSKGHQSRFFNQLVEDVGLQAFDLLTDVFLFVKDSERRFVYYNRAFQNLMKVDPADALIGLRDEDISPEYLVERYRRDDDHVLAGTDLIDIIELVRNSSDGYDWYLSSKSPVINPKGDVIGVVGVTRKLFSREHDDVASSISDLAAAVELILREYHRHITVQELARAAYLSASRFSRVFKQQFGLSPHQYLHQVRLEAACELLATSPHCLSMVAELTGFYDQSHMTNAFLRAKGVSPRRYRQLFRIPEHAAPPT